MIHYGKAEISVYRTDGVRSLLGAEVELDVFGENFMPAYTEGDNRLVVATDTMKNFVHATALDYEGDSLEELIELIGARFLETYEHMERIRVRAREVSFERKSDVLFQRSHDDVGVAELELDRSGVLARALGPRRAPPREDHGQLVRAVPPRRVHDAPGKRRPAALRPSRRALAARRTDAPGREHGSP